MAIDNQLWYQYVDEVGNNYAIRLAESTGNILGLSNINKGAYPPWPYGHKNLRHITGRDVTGMIRRRLTIPVPGVTLWLGTGVQTWVDEKGNTIIREGRFGGKEPGSK